MSRLPALAALLAGLFAAGGCETAEDARPAVFARFDAAEQEALRLIIAEDLGRKPVRFGAGDPTREPRLVVLPPPLGPHETNSPALPIIYDIRMGAEGCFLRREDGDARLPLTSVDCRDAD